MAELDALLQKLNPDQRRAVLDESRAALVCANVGSGKTTVLIAKALYQHAVRGIPLDRMVVLTFTNRAADELRERMAGADPQAKPADMPWFGTFHSVAMRLLQTVLPVGELGYTPAFTVLDPEAKVETALALIAEHGLDVKYRTKLDKRLEALDAGQPLWGAMKRADDIGRLAELLAQEKVRQNKMDFDDLLRNAALLLHKGNWSPDWIVVDEFQDCDGLQEELIRAMAGERTRLFAVGDPNQSIYGWRGGSRDVFDRFRREYGAVEFPLPVNYRSSATILEAARCFLEDRSALEGIREPGARIAVRSHYSPFLEADWLADRILRLHESGTAFRDVAVFYRLQRQSKPLEDAFGRSGIPYAVSVRKTPAEVPVLRWLLRLLNAAANPVDRGSLVSALSDPQFGELTEAQAKKAAKAGDGPGLYETVRLFPEWAGDGRTAQELWDYFELNRRLMPTSASFSENRELALAFFNRLEDFCGKSGQEFLPGLTGFLNSSALYGTEPAPGDGGDTVRLMTLHACKGLEFGHVFIVGVNDGLIPLAGERDREEEKRLFFVGITRAKDALELSYYTNPGDPRIRPGAGEYLAMLPDSLIEYASAPAAPPPDLQAFRRAILENRRNAASAPAETAKEPETQQAESPRRVRHPRYGEGVVRSETGGEITAVFGPYGAKTFSKEFCPLEFL